MRTTLQTLIEDLSLLLTDKGLVLTCAESCTGGLIAVCVTTRAGSSQIFDRGFVTYSNQAKREMLGVSQSVLDTHGAVSAECAEAMAIGALENSTADLAVSVTGIAGPDGGTNEKPVGLVYLAIASKTKDAQTFEFNFKGSRDEIRNESVKFALGNLKIYAGDL